MENRMGEISGVITKEQLEAYGGANIMLMDAGNERTQSGGGGEISGSGTVTYYLAWTSDGFTGLGWVVNGRDLSNLYPTEGEMDAYINENYLLIIDMLRNSWDLRDANCVSYTESRE